MPLSTDTAPVTVTCDVLIRGGGVAGLWTLRRLRAAGYRCVLLERATLGSGQTIASQGIIHGGIKYALAGSPSTASRAIAEMPGVWRGCMAGDPPPGHPSLNGVTVLSQHQYLWTAGGVAARFMGAAASKVIRTAVRKVEVAERPAWLAPAPRGLGGVDVYTVEEPVLDPASVLRELVRSAEGCTLLDDGRVRVEATRTILTAGAGNETWLRNEGGGKGGMQRRPLHMVMVRSAPESGLPPAYGHCVGLSQTPRLTVTSQRDARGRTVLYLGGGLAEEGVGRSKAEQIAAARAELRACLPWVDFSGAEFATLRIDRAEGVTPDVSRPDEPVIQRTADGTIAAWPTKLAFAPLLADRLLAVLESDGVRKSGGDATAPEGARRPEVAKLPWDEEGVVWVT